MKSVVFLGPTLSAQRAREVLTGCEVFPPVGQGDVLRALDGGADRIGIIDGFFDQVPSVWHKEILYAIEKGALVFGASSMGALRAAELHTLGMIGVGRIFEMYKSGVLEDDDEVAVMHGPADFGYRAISEAMVNIRGRIEEAVGEEIIDEEAASRLVAEVKRVPYQHRTFGKVTDIARELGVPALERLEAFLSAPHVSWKEHDAIELLHAMGEEDHPSPLCGFRVERTVFFERLRFRVARESFAESDPSSPPGAKGEGDQGLLGLLAEEHSEVLGVSATDEEIEDAAHEFRAARDLLDPKKILVWLKARGLSPAAFRSGVRERVILRKLQHLYGPEIAVRIRNRIPWS